MNNLVPIGDIQTMAEVAAKSKMFGFKSTEEAMAIMLLCQAENLHPAIAMRDFHVIQGRPALKADAMLARFQQAGGLATIDGKTLATWKSAKASIKFDAKLFESAMPDIYKQFQRPIPGSRRFLLK